MYPMTRTLICLAATLALSSLAAAAPEAAAAPAPAQAATLPSSIAAWQQQKKERADRAFAELLAEEGASAELDADKAQVLALIDEAAAAAAKLDRARRAYFAASFSRAGQGSAALMEEAEALMEEGWMHDTADLDSFNMWLPPCERMAREQLNVPPLLLPIGACDADEPPALTAYRFALQVELWEELQQKVAALIAGCYTGDASLTPTQDPCTRIEWKEDEAAACAELGRLFAEAEKAWADYAKAMQQLICPVPRFHGTAFSLLNCVLRLGLLDSHDKFLAAIVRGYTLADD